VAGDLIDVLNQVDWQPWADAGKYLAAGLSMGFGAIGAGVGEGYNAGEAVNAASRQPAVSGDLMRTMLIGQAVAETSGIFALVVAFLLMLGSAPANLEALGAMLGAGFAMGLGAIGAGIGAGLGGGKAAAAIGRNPATRGRVTILMLIGQGLTTSPAVFALVVAVMLLFTPYTASDLTVAVAALSAGICVGAGAIGPGLGSGIAAGSACDAVGRNPEAHAEVTRTMLVGGAVSQSTAVYAFAVSFILVLFV
jgi:F-type H+-transporting ATPase subunit c